MTNYKILFLDIDGTILRPDDTIEESTKKAVAEVQNSGIEVFLATGRPLHEIWDIGEELNIDSYIGYNGAYAIHKGKEVFKEPMRASTIEKYLNISKEYGHEMIMYTNEKNIITSLEDPILNEFIDRFHLKHNSLFTMDVIENILGITVVKLQKEDPKHYEFDNIHLSQVNLEGFHHSYDCIRDTVNKGVAVKHILELLGYPVESSIAFGDGMNDKEMLSYVGEGFAMGNAHPDLFSFAKHKTTKVTESGVYNGLKSLKLVN